MDGRNERCECISDALAEAAEENLSNGAPDEKESDVRAQPDAQAASQSAEQPEATAESADAGQDHAA